MKTGYTVKRSQLDGVEAFLRVAERRNFRAAAEDLGVSPSAISQTIRAFEAKVGVPLFTRTTRSVGLTQAGQLFLDRARPAFANLAAAYDEARNLGEQPAGLLKIYIPRPAISFLIQPILTDFLVAYPKIEVEIFAGEVMSDLVAEGFDAGIWLGEYLDADMVAVRLTPDYSNMVVGTPDLLEREGVPMRPQDLRHHSCIRIRSGHGTIMNWEFQERGRPFEVAVTGRLIVNDLGLQLSSARKGVGLVHVAEALVREDIARGDLRVVLKEFMPVSSGVFLYYPNRGQVLPKLRVFIEFILANPYLKLLRTGI